LLAPTGTGKSWLIRYGLLPIVPDTRKIVIDVKPGGERTWNGWGNDVDHISPGFGTGPDGTANYRIMTAPGDEGKHQVKEVLEIVGAEGEVILIMDDSKKITANSPNMALAGYVDGLLTDSRSLGVTVILAANSTTWAVSGLRDQCSVYFIGLMRNEEQRDRFGNIIGLPRKERQVLGTLNTAKRQFLYSDQYEGELKTAITSL
jgi:hypothetical protein